MMKIEAILQPHRLSRVVIALHAHPRFPGFTLIDAHGQGPGRGRGGHYDYDEDSVAYHRHSVLVIYCEDDEADALVELIGRAARTGMRGDGVVVVTPVTRLVRVRDLPAPTGDAP